MPMAAKEILATHPNVHIHMIGDGMLMDSIANERDSVGITSSFHLHGNMPHEQALASIFYSTIVILPSLTEGLPNVILEALTLGCAIVATRVGGTPELISHMHNGLLVEPSNPSSIAKAIMQLLDDSELRETLSANAKTSAASLTTSGSNASMTIKIYEDAIQATNKAKKHPSLGKPS